MCSVALVPKGNFLLQPSADGDGPVGFCNWQPYRVHWVNRRGLCKPAVASSKCGTGPWECTCFGIMNVTEQTDLFGHFVQISSRRREGGSLLSHSFILKSHSSNFSCYVLSFLLIYQKIFNLFFYLAHGMIDSKYLRNLLFLNSLKHSKHTNSPNILEESPTVILQWRVLSFQLTLYSHLTAVKILGLRNLFFYSLDEGELFFFQKEMILHFPTWSTACFSQRNPTV